MLICLSTQCEPPLVVTDLFEDIKDGVILLALLEVLSGQILVSTLRFVGSHGGQGHACCGSTVGLSTVLWCPRARLCTSDSAAKAG